MSRWVRLAAAIVAMIQIANLQYAWTLFVQPLRDAHSWGLSEVQWGLSIFIAIETWAMPVCGFMIDKRGARLLMTIAGVMCATGWAGMGMAHSLWELYLLYAFAGLGASIVYCGSLGVALKWFPDKRGLAAGAIAAGFGSGSALFIPLLRWMLESYGPATAFLVSGLIQGTLIIVAAQFLGGAGVTLPPGVKVSTKPMIRRQTHDFTSGEMLRSPQFYWLYAMMLMMGIGGLLATANVAPVAKTLGMSSVVGLSILVNSIANGTGRLFWGCISDWIGRERTMLIAFLIQSAALVGVMTLGPKSSTFFVVAMALVFFTWGEVYVLFPAALADFFGSKNASSNYSFLYSTKGVAAILGGGLAAKLFESTQSWGPAFYGSAVLALVSALMALGLKKMHLPVKQESSAPIALSAAEQR